MGPIEYFDEAEAEDVREIQREMAIEAAGFDPWNDDEYDYYTAEELSRGRRDGEI